MKKIAKIERCDQTPDMFGAPPKKLKFGTEPRKLARRMAPGTSVDAACQVDSAKTEKLVYDTIQSFGGGGCISDQVLFILSHRAYGAITSRYSALERKGLIYYVGDTRRGNSGRQQRVIRAKK